jgi:GntR family transcriptional regulator/MocR family aminotransferase
VVEEYGYQPAWAALRRAGAELSFVSVDSQGLVVDELEALARAGSISAVYVTPHHQFPTLVTMSAPRRHALLELARCYRFAIIEDDYDHEFHYRGRPVLPLASADTAGNVIHVGTMSKILAPGLRVGYVVGPVPLIERLARERYLIDRQGDQVGEEALAELLEDDLVQRHARRVRRIYLARRELMASELRRRFGDRLRFEEPDGGLALWVRTHRAGGLRSWQRRCEERGVRFSLGCDYHARNRPQPFIRIGFAACDENELADAIRIMAEEYERSGG